MVEETLGNLGIVATATAGVGLVARYGIQRFSALGEQGIEQSAEVVEDGIDRVAEVVESTVEELVDGAVARHRAELDDRRVSSSRLTDRRAEIVVELYQRFVQFERDMHALTTGRSTATATEALLESATASGDEFASFYTEHKLYFPSDVCDAVERLQKEVNGIFLDIRTGRSGSGPSEPDAAIERWLSDWQHATQEAVPELKRELEAHFRALLGVDDE